MSYNNPIVPNPVSQAKAALETVPLEQRIVAVAAALLEAGVISDQQLRTAVFWVSGVKMG
jgi:hypothetical protein